MAHVAVTHCLFNPGARFLLGRQSMPALKATILADVINHISPDLREGRDYWFNQTTGMIRFSNKSQIVCWSWSDGRFHKVRSVRLSGAAIEEGTESDTDEAYTAIKLRVGRLPHVKENIIITATNPENPGHWLYKHFHIGTPETRPKTRHVYYSVTTDNPFLPPQYIEQLKRDLDPKLARRMIYGEWIEISGEVIYYNYDRSVNYSTDAYRVDPSQPIILAWDFNIGHGKPMSCCLMQHIGGHFHVFAEAVLEGANTANILEELESRQFLRPEWTFIVCGDAAGKNRDTRSSRSDYEIITKFLSDRALRYTFAVPAANPPIRLRHNRVNAFCRNSLGDSRLTVYSTAPTVDEGLRLVKLKEGGQYLEDDSKRYQHVTTALGYAIVFLSAQEARGASTSRQL